MTSAPGNHGQAHSELVDLYALQALAPSEVRMVEALISACPDCRQEMETLRPIIDAFVSWPADVLRPSPSLRERLAERIGADTSGGRMVPAPMRWAEADWNEVAPGVSSKVLATDLENHRVCMLVRLAPHTGYPPHRHEGVEEIHMLEGELIIDGETLAAGDYRRAGGGSVDHRVWSETGCTCLLITSLHDAIL